MIQKLRVRFVILAMSTLLTVLLALRYEGLQLLLLRRTLPELYENHLRPLLGELNGVARYNGTQRVFTFPNGSRIRLGYCAEEKDVYQYQGQEYDVVGLEEATHFTESQMQFLTTCNRSVRRDFSPRMYYTCNPGGVATAGSSGCSSTGTTAAANGRRTIASSPPASTTIPC